MRKIKKRAGANSCLRLGFGPKNVPGSWSRNLKLDINYMAKTPAQLRKEAANAMRRASGLVNRARRLQTEALREQRALRESVHGRRPSALQVHTQRTRKARQTELQRRRKNAFAKARLNEFRRVLGNFGNSPTRFMFAVSHWNASTSRTDPYGMGKAPYLPSTNPTAVRLVYNYLTRLKANRMHAAQLAATRQAMNTLQRQIQALSGRRPSVR